MPAASRLQHLAQPHIRNVIAVDSSSAAERHGKQHTKPGATPGSREFMQLPHTTWGMSLTEQSISCQLLPSGSAFGPLLACTRNNSTADVSIASSPMLLQNTMKPDFSLTPSAITGSRTDSCKGMAAASRIAATLQDVAAPAAAGPTGTPSSCCCGTRCHPLPPWC
jgi:hypothetical protein